MIPRDEIRRCGSVENWAKELIDQCSVSQTRRRDQARKWRTLFHTGTMDGASRKVNLVHNYIDKLASLLFSPSDVRFEITFDTDEVAQWTSMGDVAARYLNRNFKARKCNIAFSGALEIALVESCCFLKLAWGAQGYAPHTIRQQFIGVGREDLNDISDQDVITHTYYLTINQFRRLISGKKNVEEIVQKVSQHFTERGVETAYIDIAAGSYFHEIVVGGNNPVGTITGTNSKGSVGVFGPPIPVLSPETASRLIQVTDIWFLNDEANEGKGGWATIRYVEPDIVIDGDMILRNLGDIPNTHPFVKVSPNEISGYFWGLSELEWVAQIEEWFAARVGNVDDIFALRARPPRSFEGYSGITPEKMRALLTRGGVFTSDLPSGTTRITSHAPDMPPEALAYLQFIHGCFDEAGGMTPVLSGQGESGVRAGSHAATLLRTSTPRLRDKATLVEAQLTDFGDLCFQLSQAKDARIFSTAGDQKQEFLLSQLPDDAVVSVDSHSSSPAFSGDSLQLAFALHRSGAIDGEDLLKLAQPPHVEELILKLRAREKAQQQFLQQHPELLEKGAKGRSRK